MALLTHVARLLIFANICSHLLSSSGKTTNFLAGCIAIKNSNSNNQHFQTCLQNNVAMWLNCVWEDWMWFLGMSSSSAGWNVDVVMHYPAPDGTGQHLKQSAMRKKGLVSTTVDLWHHPQTYCTCTVMWENSFSRLFFSHCYFGSLFYTLTSYISINATWRSQGCMVTVIFSPLLLDVGPLPISIGQRTALQ